MVVTTIHTARLQRMMAVLVLAVMSLIASACGDVNVNIGSGSDRVNGSGEVVVESRQIADFERIVLAGEGTVRLGAGPDGSIEIETDDNLIAHIETEVVGETLTISTEQGVDIDPSDGVIYRLGCPRLVEARLSGAGTIDLADCVTGDGLALELSGAGTIDATELNVSTLDVSLPGAGSINVAGTAELLDVDLTGAGEFEGGDLRAVDAEVRSSGVGATSIWVTDTLDLRMTGVGSIRYYGEPVVSQTITGVGVVESLGPK